MDLRTAQELLSYNTWANTRVLEAAAALDRPQFVRVLGGGHASVQGTLTHILWAEWLWLERWQGGSPKRVFSPEEFPSVRELEARWGKVQEAQQAFLQGLEPEQLQRVVAYTNPQGEVWEYPLWRQIYHLFNHSAYHRGQVIDMLRVLGASTVTTDFLNFCDEVK